MQALRSIKTTILKHNIMAVETQEERWRRVDAENRRKRQEQIAALNIQPGNYWWRWDGVNGPSRFLVIGPDPDKKDNTYWYVTKTFGRAPQRWFIEQFEKNATRSEEEAYENYIRETESMLELVKSQLVRIKEQKEIVEE